MIGLPAHAAIGGPGEWLDRVHPDDIVNLNTALETHLAGSTPVFQHEHRIRHEDGVYRRFLCRGVAVRGAGRKPDRIAGSLTDTTEQAIAQERLRSVGFVDSLTGLSNRAVFVEGLGPAARRVPAPRSDQRLRGPLSRPGPVQDRQRQSRPHGRRRAADRGVAASRDLPAAGRRPGAAGRRRVRDLPERAARRRPGQRHRRPDPGFAERAVLDRRPRSVHLGEHRDRLRPGALHQPGRGDARRRHRDVSRQVARQVAARGVRRRHARARARPPEPRERPPPGDRRQRLRGALPADRVAGLGDVRRLRVAGPMEPQRRAGLSGQRSSRSPRSSG